VALLLLELAAVARTGSTPSVQTSEGLGNFACYAPRFSEFLSRSVRLSDQFGNRTTLIGRPLLLCSPASVNGSRIHNRVAHLTCYPVPMRRQTTRTLRIKNEFGTLRVALRPMQLLCVASSAAAGGPLHSPPKTLDHFTCYSVEQRSKFRVRAAVTVDPFHKNKTSDKVIGAKELCVPARVNGSTRLQKKPLLCFDVDSHARSRTVVVRNRFGIFTASSGTRTRLCLRSSTS
jgi:hypothetical protein